MIEIPISFIFKPLPGGNGIRFMGFFLDDGTWCTDESRLKQETMRYFQQLFCHSRVVDSNAFYLRDMPCLSDSGCTTLNAPVTKEEVRSVVIGMKSFKAPGPGGFQPFFFKAYWDLVGEDLWRLVADAFLWGRIDPRIVEVLIVLIPKMDQPSRLKEFRPISLCNVVYKVITKVLVNRLRPFLDELIGPLQGSFIPGRGTTDNIIIAQEVINYMHKYKGKTGCLAFKVDLEKAYDSLSWEFLDAAIRDFGLPSNICDLIMTCVKSSSLSILWNGARLDSFSPTRGLRQGDPLSPYLFVLCMEKLSIYISQRVGEGSWLPISISKDGPPISHLLFADDVLLFCKAKNSQVRIVLDTLDDFCMASGLRVNFKKSRALSSKNVSRRRKENFTGISSIRFTTDLDKYLGVPLVQGRVKKSIFFEVLEKIQRRLASWKGQLFNRTGRMCLAKSVLTSLPIYSMQTLWFPTGVCEKIDQMTRSFIWKGASDSRSFNLVNWETITCPKRNGGLGICKAQETNIALLGKII